MRVDDTENVRKLLRRAEAALQALSEGRANIVSGTGAVSELRQQLDDVGVRLGVDLREVQESVVEHAAMYAKNTEVLSGMLHLVFCFDLVGKWLTERDAKMREIEFKLGTLEYKFGECDMLIADLNREIQACSDGLAALKIAKEPCERNHGVEAKSLPTPKWLLSDGLHVNLKQVGTGTGHDGLPTAGTAPPGWSETLEKLQRENAKLRAPSVTKATTNSKALEKLERENSELRAQLKMAAEATRVSTITYPVTVAGMANPAVLSGRMSPIKPIQTLLGSLEQLEPMLAALPAGIVPGMIDVQEEACEAYGHLRITLLDALAAAAEVPAASPNVAGFLVNQPALAATAMTANPGVGHPALWATPKSLATSADSVGGCAGVRGL